MSLQPVRKEPLAWAVPPADWQAFIEELGRQRTVYAPQRDGDTILYRPLRPGDQPAWDHLPSTLSPRGVFLPQRETLFRYGRDDHQVRLETPEPGPASVILGVPPCDARAFRLLDRVFDTAERPDVYYVARRQSAVVIGVACREPRSTCFCRQVGGDPASREGSDILLTNLGATWLVEALTPAGQEILAGVVWPAARPAQHAAARRLARQARRMLPPPGESLAVPELSPELLEAPLWASLAQRCLGCGACSFACPSCHCFDIVDEPACAPCGERVRVWDSCQFALYTLEASGHNPRPSRRERLRQRVLDKFAYSSLQVGKLACVGCGRCIQVCPVNIDLREVIAEVHRVIRQE